MYQLDDKQAAIREIKKYLYVVSTKLYPQIDRTTIDGQYDEPTRSAIKEFQRIMKLEDSGEVDIDTFNALYEAYDRARDDFYAIDYVIEGGHFPFGIGSTGEDVRALHMLINELAKDHADHKNVGTGSYFSARTARAVCRLQRAYGMHESGIVDKYMYSQMLMELDAIRRRDKNPDRVI